MLDDIRRCSLDAQFFECRLYVWKFDEHGFVGNLFVVENESYSPDRRREANALRACQVVQDDFGLDLGSHAAVYEDYRYQEGPFGLL